MYSDDFIILYKLVEEEVSTVDELPSLISAAGISLKYSKCYLFKYQIDYLGYVVLHGNLAASDKSGEAVRLATFTT